MLWRREARVTADHAEAVLLAVAAHYADLHPDPAVHRDDEDETDRLPGMERARVYGGEGCPEVAEFAPVELGAVLGISSYAAAELIGDALGLRHRLPLTWARVVAGEVQAWRARKIATACQPLNPAAAGFVDATVAPVAQSLTSYRLAKVVRAAILHADPALARAAADRAAADRGVWVGHDDIDGTRTVLVKASTGDAARFDAAVDLLADCLARLGRHRCQGPAAGQGDRLAGQPAGRPQPLRRSHHPHPPRPRHRPDTDPDTDPGTDAHPGTGTELDAAHDAQREAAHDAGHDAADAAVGEAARRRRARGRLRHRRPRRQRHRQRQRRQPSTSDADIAVDVAPDRDADQPLASVASAAPVAFGASGAAPAVDHAADPAPGPAAGPRAGSGAGSGAGSESLAARLARLRDTTGYFAPLPQQRRRRSPGTGSAPAVAVPGRLGGRWCMCT